MFKDKVAVISGAAQGIIAEIDSENAKALSVRRISI